MSSTQKLIAALGSSFAAGPHIDPVAEPRAGRSARNYPHQLAALLGAELVDLTVVGSTTANILDEPQQLFTGDSFPPQVDGLGLMSVLASVIGFVMFVAAAVAPILASVRDSRRSRNEALVEARSSDDSLSEPAVWC